MKIYGLSIIVPTYNESGNILSLVRRIVDTLQFADTPYEIIFVDDHSTDTTRTAIKRHMNTYTPITLLTKLGTKGKGYSLLEGYEKSQYSYIAMLDADLQYPPEILPELLASAKTHGFAVANRKTYTSTFMRRFASRFNAFIFGRLLLNLKTDVQSGLKIFPAEVFDHVNPKLISGWAIDIPLVFTAYELGHNVGHVDIDFKPRTEGKSNVHFVGTALEIAIGAIKTKLSDRIHKIKPIDTDTMLGSGIAYKRKRFITHTTLSHKKSALVTFTAWQKLFLALVVAACVWGIIRNPLSTIITGVAVLSAIYFIDVLFNLFVILKSLHFPPEIVIPDEALQKIDDTTLPIYSILCPLYKEAQVLPQFIEAMRTLDWPKDKLDVLLLLEADDTHTIKVAQTMGLPSYFRVVVVPFSEPKTKPKASNYGLSMARGEYVVVYDAEDKPDPQQLKKAYLAFAGAPKNVACLQAKLNYYNPHDNLLTRLFTAEYSLWFDVTLPGLQSIATTIPLGGTSNHFRTDGLRAIEGWDAFNVTEDCDLGARLFKAGYQTAIIDSTTLEEANSNVGNWFRQRSRWIKGYFQTYLVHMRNPLQFARRHGIHALIFQLTVGGKLAFMLINPFLWIITISYFTLYRFVGPTIESIYPASVFYMAAFSLVLGNFIYLYNYMIGCAKRNHWELIKYIFFVPFYWLMISWAAGIALFQLFFKPHYWEKTIHGLHIAYEEEKKAREIMRVQSANVRARRLQKLADFTGSQFVSGGILVASSLIGNVLNFLYNSYLGRTVSIEDFGIISLIGSFIYIAQIVFSALSRSMTHKSAYLLGEHGTPIQMFWAKVRRQSYLFGIIISILWLASTPFLQSFFKIDSILPFVLFTPVWLIGTLASIDGGFLGGNLKFGTLAVLAVSEAAFKLLFTVVLVQKGMSEYVYAAIPLSNRQRISYPIFTAIQKHGDRIFETSTSLYIYFFRKCICPITSKISRKNIRRQMANGIYNKNV